jgi:hypothetical protein
MKELSGRASAVLGRYRTVEALRETEKSRLLETLQGRVARGDVPLPGVDLPPPQPAPSMHFLERLWSAPLAKAGVGIVGIAVAAAVAVTTTRPKAPIARAPRSVVLADDPGTLNHARPEPLPTAEPAAPPDEPAPAVTRPNKARTKAAASARSIAPAPQADEATVDEEVRLLHDAQLAVRSGDARRALSLLDEHASRFPAGKLADAREVTRMLALCDLGARAAAREKADHFLAEHPGSPFSDRVRRICAQP